MARFAFRLLPILFALSILYSPANSKCLPRREITRNFCANTPVVSDFSLTAYTGRWFQLYTTADAGRFSGNRCVTANYTAQADGSIGVLNCQYPASVDRPTCVRAVAARRPGKGPGSLTVSFRPDVPPNPYNVVATLGFKSYGYYAAAVFFCNVTAGRVERGFFIIARTAYKPQTILRRLKAKLRCLGFPVDDRFERSRHPPKCMYFDGLNGFQSSGGMPPPGVTRG